MNGIFLLDETYQQRSEWFRNSYPGQALEVQLELQEEGSVKEGQESSEQMSELKKVFRYREKECSEIMLDSESFEDKHDPL